jgi:hypothetical protein
VRRHVGWIGLALHVGYRRLRGDATADTQDGLRMRPGDFLETSGAVWVVTDIGGTGRPMSLTRFPR